jgi:hypothetical protein
MMIITILQISFIKTFIFALDLHLPQSFSTLAFLGADWCYELLWISKSILSKRLKLEIVQIANCFCFVLTIINFDQFQFIALFLRDIFYFLRSIKLIFFRRVAMVLCFGLRVDNLATRGRGFKPHTVKTIFCLKVWIKNVMVFCNRCCMCCNSENGRVEFLDDWLLNYKWNESLVADQDKNPKKTK